MGSLSAGAVVGALLWGADSLQCLPAIRLSDIFWGSSGKQRLCWLAIEAAAIKALPAMRVLRKSLDRYSWLRLLLISAMTNGKRRRDCECQTRLPDRGALPFPFPLPSCSPDGKR